MCGKTGKFSFDWKTWNFIYNRFKHKHTWRAPLFLLIRKAIKWIGICLADSCTLHVIEHKKFTRTPNIKTCLLSHFHHFPRYIFINVTIMRRRRAEHHTSQTRWDVDSWCFLEHNEIPNNELHNLFYLWPVKFRISTNCANSSSI